MQFVQFLLRCRIEFLLLPIELECDIIIAMHCFFDRADIILESGDVRFESADIVFENDDICSEFTDIVFELGDVRFESADIVFENDDICSEFTDIIFEPGDCYPAFYLVLNHTAFNQIKKRHSINYSDGFYIGLLYAVPLVLS